MAGNMFDPAVNADGALGGSRGVGGTSEGTILREGQEHIHKTGGVGYQGQTSSGVGSGVGSSGLGSNNYSQGVDSSAQHQEGIDHIRSEAGLGQSARSTGLDSNSGVSSGLSSGERGVAGVTTGSGYGSSNTGYGSSETGYGSSTTAGPHSSNLANKADPRVDSDLSESRGTTSGTGVNDTSSRSGLTGSNANTRDSHTAGDIHGSGSQAREGTAAGGQDMENTTTSGDHSKSTSGHHVGGYIGNPNMDSELKGPPESIPMAGNERIGTKHWGESKVIKDTAPPKGESSGIDGKY